jgi:uncharacterized protein (DUF736 family)
MNTKQNQNSEWSKRELGALWKKDSAKGKYLSGYLNLTELGITDKVNVVLFSNKNKSKDTAPDFRIYLSVDKNNSNAAPQKAAPAKTFAKSKPAPVAKVAEESEEEDLL